VIVALTADDIRTRLAGLVHLLEDTVNSGASIGFLPPMANGEADEYWQSVAEAVRGGSRILLAALEDGVVIGSVQLQCEPRKNGSHRAEVMKLMVHTAARRRGIGRSLMEAAERAALDAGRMLLVLDTRCGDPSERLYREMGYQMAGVIPGYARSANGTLHDTVIMYRRLIPQSA
jgi:acetyltransferase